MSIRGGVDKEAPMSSSWTELQKLKGQLILSRLKPYGAKSEHICPRWTHRSLLISPLSMDTLNQQVETEQPSLKGIQKLAKQIVHIAQTRK